MPVLAFPKGEARKAQKERRKRENQKRRNLCIDAVFARDRSTCQKCGAYVAHKRDPWCTEHNIGHVHEIVPRSLGGSPFDPANCLLLCGTHHRMIHGRG